MLALFGAPPTLAQAAPPGALRIDRDRFTVLHYPADAQMAVAALESAASRDSFPWLPRANSRVVIMIAPTAAVFRQWAGQSSRSWAAAVAFPAQHRVVVQGGRPPSNAGNPLQVLRHELAHIALHDYLGDLPPRWFDEGYASYAAGEERMDGFLSTNAALVFRRMPTLTALDSLLESPRGTDARAGYALALRAVTDLAAIDPANGLGPFLANWRARGRFDLAMRRTFAQTSEDFEREWQRRSRWRFAFLALAADSALATGLVVVLLLPLYRSKRREQAVRLEAMRAREAIAENANRSASLDVLLRSIGSGRAQPDPDA